MIDNNNIFQGGNIPEYEFMCDAQQAFSRDVSKAMKWREDTEYNYDAFEVMPMAELNTPPTDLLDSHFKRFMTVWGHTGKVKDRRKIFIEFFFLATLIARDEKAQSNIRKLYIKNKPVVDKLFLQIDLTTFLPSSPIVYLSSTPVLCAALALTLIYIGHVDDSTLLTMAKYITESSFDCMMTIPQWIFFPEYQAYIRTVYESLVSNQPMDDIGPAGFFMWLMYYMATSEPLIDANGDSLLNVEDREESCAALEWFTSKGYDSDLFLLTHQSTVDFWKEYRKKQKRNDDINSISYRNFMLSVEPFLHIAASLFSNITHELGNYFTVVMEGELNDQIKQKMTDLNQRRYIAESKSKQLDQLVSKKQNIINQLLQENDQLKKELNFYKDEPSEPIEIEEDLSAFICNDDDVVIEQTSENAVPIDQMIQELQKLNGTVIGGREGWKQKFAGMFPNVKVVPTSAYHHAEVNVATTDYVLVKTDYFSHAAFYRYSKRLKQNNIPMICIKETNMDTVIKVLYDRLICKKKE